MIIAIDLGNTRAKVKAGELLSALPYDGKWLDELEKSVPAAERPILGLSSVNPVREKELRERLDENPRIKLVAVRDILPPLNGILDYPQIQGVGIDRLLGLIGAGPGEGSVITVDCGTAITVNVARGTEFLGGLIAAGYKTQLDALRSKSPVLEPGTIEDTPILIGRNTQEALSSGVLRFIAGGIETICRDIAEQHFPQEKPRTIITGGDGQMIFHLLRDKGFSYDASLVLKGIERLLREKISTEET